jgi:GntR family negative regulator for fad regulon and positive regulator of fabA
VFSGNPIFTLILNGFSELYRSVGQIYFHSAQSRQHSRAFYRDLRSAAQDADASRAGAITRQVMQDSLALWQTRQTA